MKRLLQPLLSRYVTNIALTPSFSSFIISVLFSQIAFNMMNVVLIFVVFSITHSSFAVSMLILTFLIPQVIFSFIGGIVADMKNKKNILIIGNILRALVVLILFVNFHSTILVYLVALTLAMITQFYVPAEAPLMPYLVDKKDLLVANSVFGMVLFSSQLVGFVLAGPLVQLFGRGGAFLAITLLYIISAVLASLIPRPSNQIGTEYSSSLVRKSLKDEIHNLYMLLRYTRDAGDSFFLLAFSQVVVLVLANIIPGYAQSVLNVSVENLSLLVFAPAVAGMIFSALVIASLLKDTEKVRLMDVGVFLSGIVLILFPFIGHFVNLAAIQYINSELRWVKIEAATLVPLLAFVAGFANAFIFVPSQTMIQEIVPEESRSKIFGLLFALIGALSLVPVVISGGVADVFGVGSVLIGLGLIIIVIGIMRTRFHK